MLRSLLVLLLVIFGLALALPRARSEDDAADVKPEAQRPVPPAGVARFVDNYCVRCHNADEPSGQLDLSARVSAKTWREALARARKGSMPPPDEDVPRPKASEVAALGSWVATLGVPARSARAALRRLNRSEYNNAVRDLLGVHSQPASAFPDDDVAHGFDTASEALSLPPPLLEQYLAAAEGVAREAVLVFEPLRDRRLAKTLERKGRSAHPDRGDFWKLSTNGSFTGRFPVPHTGTYTVRVRCYADQAGPQPARVALLIDSKREALRAVKGENEQTLSFTLKLERGRRRVEAAFINDFWDPKHKDPRQRDRNLSLAWIEVEGPTERPALPRSHRALLGGAERLSWEQLPKALRALASRAYRRPVREGELARLVKLALSAKAQGRRPEQALQLGLTAILVSPGFLLRADLDAGPAKGRVAAPVGEHALASRLSFFLWGSLPDDSLRAAADAGRLRKELSAQVARMLDDPKSRALVDQFAAQWLQLRRLGEASPDATSFPDFSEELRDSMRGETELFVQALFRENRPVRDVLAARFTFVDERLAKHYGIPGVRGKRFRRVSVPAERAGLLTHASVLTMTSEPTRASAVRRGKWILEALLDDPPPPPPPGADSIAEALAVQKGLSERQRLSLHRKRKDCAGCHARLDPLGFALDGFDAVGSRRRDAQLVDRSARLPDGTRFEGALGLRSVLLARAPEVTAALARRLLVFSLGRALAAGERAEVDALSKRLGPDVRFHALLQALIRTRAFQTRHVRKGP